MDSITLSGLSEDYIVDSIAADFGYALLNLKKDEVAPTEPWDSVMDTATKQMEIYQKFSVDEKDKRIEAVLKVKDISVNDDTLKTYYHYLVSQLKAPCLLTGMEDFDWEEPYVFGGWSQKEYKELKKTRASYTETFELLEIDGFEEFYGVMAKVKRVSDKKRFSIPLWELEVVNEADPNFLIVSDYASWMTNYCS